MRGCSITRGRGSMRREHPKTAVYVASHGRSLLSKSSKRVPRRACSTLHSWSRPRRRLAPADAKPPASLRSGSTRPAEPGTPARALSRFVRTESRHATEVSSVPPGITLETKEARYISLFCCTPHEPSEQWTFRQPWSSSPRHPFDPKRPRHTDRLASHRTRSQTTTRLLPPFIPENSTRKPGQASEAFYSWGGPAHDSACHATRLGDRRYGADMERNALQGPRHAPTTADRSRSEAPRQSLPSHRLDRFSSCFSTVA